MEDTDKVLLGVIAVASVATAINTGITAGKSTGGGGTGGTPIGGGKVGEEEPEGENDSKKPDIS